MSVYVKKSIMCVCMCVCVLCVCMYVCMYEEELARFAVVTKEFCVVDGCVVV